MIKHVMVLGVSVVFALGMAQEVVRLSGARGASPAALAAAAPVTETAPVISDTPAQVVRSTDGQYWAEAQVNGRWIHCLVDTGASAVSLTPADAQRLGLEPASLDYSTPINTAHGLTRGAKVDLASVAVAGARVEHVTAIIVPEGLSTSLLGMSYLGRLSRFEATRTSLILRP